MFRREKRREKRRVLDAMALSGRSRLPALFRGEVSVEKLSEMMAPQKVDGKWRKPEVSRRLVAKVRKAWLLDGRAWPFEEERTNYGGWAIADLPPVKQKGKKVDRNKLEKYVTHSLFFSSEFYADTTVLKTCF